MFPGTITTVSPSASPLLVGLHGWLLSRRLWQPLERELAPQWDLWCPDLPGFGGNPRPRDLQPSLASYGRWLAAEVRTRSEGRPVVLIGHSLGGSVALHAARLLEDRLVALVQIAAGGGIYQPRSFAQLRWGGSLLVGLRPAWLRWLARLDLPGLEAMGGTLLAERRAARGLLACSTNRGAVHQLPRLTAALTVPSLWIVGSRDGVMEPCYVRHLAGYSPLHQLELIEGAGHLPMRDMPTEVATRIDTFLRELLPEQGKAQDADPEKAQSVASPFSCRSANCA